MARNTSIPPAELLSSTDHVVPGQLRITELLFRVPLDYSRPDDESITLFARRAVKNEPPVVSAPATSDPSKRSSTTKPYMVYLEGGPGFGNKEPQEHPVVAGALSKGYQVLLLDHRGTGLSTPVSAETLTRLPTEQAQADYLRLLRQDNTVRDCEAVRQCLTSGWPESKAKWSIWGQSYGGFVSLSYLSMHPEGLSEVFLTGGLAPVGKTADEVYRATFPRAIQRNVAYYAKFPEDVANVRQIASYIEKQDGGFVHLPSGGILTVARLLTLGINFGFHGGLDSVHAIILHLKTSLDQFGFLTRASLAPIESNTPLDNNIIYAIIHEAIYCDGPGYASDWAAYRVGRENPCYPWLKKDSTPAADAERDQKPLYFSGEHIFPLHFETYPELRKLRVVAQMLAGHKEWPPLYDIEQLRKNKVPVYAASFVEDLYVDNKFGRETAALVKGTKVFETNVLYHSALRAKTNEIFQQLFALRDDVID